MHTYKLQSAVNSARNAESSLKHNSFQHIVLDYLAFFFLTESVMSSLSLKHKPSLLTSRGLRQFPTLQFAALQGAPQRLLSQH